MSIYDYYELKTLEVENKMSTEQYLCRTANIDKVYNAVTRVMMSLEDNDIVPYNSGNDAEFEVIDQKIIDEKDTEKKQNIIKRFYEWLKKVIKLFINWIRNLGKRIYKIFYILMTKIILKLSKEKNTLVVYYKKYKTYDDAKKAGDGGMKVYCFGLNMLFSVKLRSVVDEIVDLAKSLNDPFMTNELRGSVNVKRLVGDANINTFKKDIFDPAADYINVFKAFDKLTSGSTTYEEHNELIKKLRDADLSYKRADNNAYDTSFMTSIILRIGDVSRCAEELKNFIINTCDEKSMQKMYDISVGRLARSLSTYDSNVTFLNLFFRKKVELVNIICTKEWEKIAKNFDNFIEKNKDNLTMGFKQLWFIVNTMGSISTALPLVLLRISSGIEFSLTHSTRSSKDI